jgi:hypothetical protein
MSSVIIAGDTSGSITLAAPAIAGSTVLTLPAVSGTVMVNGPAFSAYQSTGQTITGGAASAKILFQIEEFDTNNNYSSSRFTPTVAGYYQVNASYQSLGANIPTVELWKNGSTYKYGTYFGASGTNPIVTGAWFIYCNGTTDYLEIYGSGSATANTSATAIATYFQAAMIRGA